MRFMGTSSNPDEKVRLQTLHPYIEHLTRGSATFTETDNWPTHNILRLVTGTMTIGTEVSKDIDLQRVLDRIRKQAQEKQKEATRLQSRLSSKNFTEKAEPSVIEESESRLKDLTQELALLGSSEQQIASILD